MHQIEPFSGTVGDQILVAAVYEECKIREERTTPLTEEPIVLILQRGTRILRQVVFKGEPRLLSGSVNHTLSHDSSTDFNLAINSIVVEAGKAGWTGTCLGQLTANMGAVHVHRRDQGKGIRTVFGVASDGNSFCFLVMDSDGMWSESRLS